MNAIETIGSALGGKPKPGGGWMCRCPAHDDKEPSLSIDLGDNLRPVVRCWAGCSNQDVISALRARGLWPERLPLTGRTQPAPEKRTKETNSQRRPDREAAAAEAARRWEAAGPANRDHPYLAGKGLEGQGLRQEGRLLLVPMCDTKGAVCSLQTINPEGQKRFLKGGAVSGLVVLIGGPPEPGGPVYRAIDAWQPTLLIDEADAFLKDNEELRGIINSGHTRDSAYVIRTVGDNFTPTKFNTWGAKAIAGIGHVADTIMDRSVILELRRKLPHEEVARLRYAEADLFGNLRAKLARFADDYAAMVRQTRPPLPSCLNDRAQDNWEPLLAIAMVAGGHWLEIGTRAAIKLSGCESAAQTIGGELLADIKEIFEMRDMDRISTADLIRALCDDDEKAWATYNRGNPISPRQLANKLKGYGITSTTLRFRHTGLAKGYERKQFEEAFSRYIPVEHLVLSVTA
jgi:putative DNA primase/helicase